MSHSSVLFIVENPSAITAPSGTQAFTDVEMAAQHRMPDGQLYKWERTGSYDWRLVKPPRLRR